jgi:hypothetical protein
MSTSRYIRKRNTVAVGYLYRITRIYVLVSLLTLILGLIITQLPHHQQTVDLHGLLMVWNGG